MAKFTWMYHPSRRPQTYRVPECLKNAQFRNLPLYLQVAWWIALRNTPATVLDVSEAFHISARRTSDIFLYLNSIDHIDCQRLWVPSPNGGRCRALTVSGLSLKTIFRKRELVPRRIPRKRTRTHRESPSENIRNLRAWMVSRRPGETIPADQLNMMSPSLMDKRD
ncbi:hypothetical protein CSY93_15615 [Salmonella enterica]|nr:hypothetical protein [Salmonella enterica subsp. salamae serovar Sofia]ECF6016426.1 CaiF/GrlA family transcriptional regulator [Salmonella enterica subsp. salamae serovar Sofia]EDL8861583.1 hypothetical protein [Salmonella enterica]EDQ9771765.1 CaiF/GrlA family transcriptional regulator [Salmonella enterica subsp. salamae]